MIKLSKSRCYMDLNMTKYVKKKDGILSKNEPKIRKIMKITMRYGLLNEKMRQKY